MNKNYKKIQQETSREIEYLWVYEMVKSIRRRIHSRDLDANLFGVEERLKKQLNKIRKEIKELE